MRRAFFAACSAAICLSPAAPCQAGDRFIPVKGMSVQFPERQTEAARLAIESFVRKVRRLSGTTVTIQVAPRTDEGPCIVVRRADKIPAELTDAPKDICAQSYRIAPPDATGTSASRKITLESFGEDGSPRSSLGLAYAFAELLRRLDIRGGEWGIALPETEVVAVPSTPNRTLYLMNSNNANPGLSLEYFSAEDINDYVDFLIDARYSRVSFWQWSSMYLYPDGDNALGAAAEKKRDFHFKMKSLFECARQRGLEVYHQLTPVHIPLELLPPEARFASTGYYGRSGACWSQPEAREMIRKVAEREMRYFGPVNGYIVWFYDPGGCFCASCKPNQGRNLFEQLMLVSDLAKEISPNAKMEAVLWPTWCFPQHQAKGIPMSEGETESFVKDLLSRCLAQFGPRNLTIMDSCEADNTNVYNGLVKPAEFRRNAFMYSVLGMASEHGYPFARFRFGYLGRMMGLARDRGLEEGTLFIQYAATNRPGVYAVGHTMYTKGADGADALRAYAATVAKGDALAPFTRCLEALEEEAEATTMSAKGAALARAFREWEKASASPLFRGDRDWFNGFIKAQRHYFRLATASGEDDSKRLFADFKADVGAIPMYRAYINDSLTTSLVTKLHLDPYWIASKEEKIIEVP
jgi:hypothetical protein